MRLGPQELFAVKLLHTSNEQLSRTLERRADESTASQRGHAWAYQGVAREWHAFSTAWNALVHSLRARDMLADAERDDLLFVHLSADAHREFFTAAQYVVLPTMVSAPMFTSQRGERSLVTPSTTTYSGLLPIVEQLRDLVLYLLVVLGVLAAADVTLFREDLAHLLAHARLVFREVGLREQQKLVHHTSVALEKFVSLCHDAARDTNGKLQAALGAVDHGSDNGEAAVRQIAPLRAAFGAVLDAAAGVVDAEGVSFLDDGIEPELDRRAAADAAPKGPPKGSSRFLARVGSAVRSRSYVKVGEDEEGAAGLAAIEEVRSREVSQASQESTTRDASDSVGSAATPPPAGVRVSFATDTGRGSERTSSASSGESRVPSHPAVGAFRRLRHLLRLEAPDEHDAVLSTRELLDGASLAVLQPLSRAFTTLNPGGEVLEHNNLLSTSRSLSGVTPRFSCTPRPSFPLTAPSFPFNQPLPFFIHTHPSCHSQVANPEARRQIISFCASLRNTQLCAPPQLSHMRTLSVLTPYFQEDVAYSMTALMAASDDNTTLLAILRALHPEEFRNLRERIGLAAGEITAEECDRVEGLSLASTLRLARQRGSVNTPLLATLQVTASR